MKRFVLPIIHNPGHSSCLPVQVGQPRPKPSPPLRWTPLPRVRPRLEASRPPRWSYRFSRQIFPSPPSGASVSVDVKVGDKVTAGQPLIHLDTALLEARVREAEANLAAAEIQVAYLKRVGTDERFLESALADVDRAQALLDSAKTTLEAQSALLAPIDGTVVTLDVNPGETVVPGRVIVILGDLTKYQVETIDLSERDVTRVKVGQPVRISVEALGKEFTGKVSEIALVSTTLGGDVVYTVTIEFDEQPQGLMWGMSADVEIPAE